jgi:hypothetical protein
LGGIYLIEDGGQLVEMPEMAYDSEALLQGLLAQYPSLLAGDQIDSIAPRRWLLISREVPLASQEGGAGRWSVDHVFLDQDAVPTLVEVKRSTDTRIRREVVGQMLDYAANAVVYWPIEAMQAQFELRCQEEQLESLEVFAESLGVSQEVDRAWDRFWQQAKINLQAGKIRMVFVADKIPDELRRIVEFLNVQMDPAEVLAVEIKQYVGQRQRAMVPRVVGQLSTSGNKATVARPPSRQWDEESFFVALAAARSSDVVAAARRIIEWIEQNGWRPRYGRGGTRASFNPTFTHNGQDYSPCYVSARGRIQVNFGPLKTRPPFDEEGMRRALLARLNALDGISLTDDGIDGFPAFDLSSLIAPSSMEQFLDVLAWVALTARAHQTE